MNPENHAENNNEIMVSIVCTVYNHEPFLKSTLEGFISQNTNFKFEAIIHDDASTDNSAEIIREYQKKYPDIIKPIYQTENQYSQKRSILYNYLFPAAKGKYVAMCEGDDYWIDNHKLQKQIDYMESHPECTFCFTNAKCEENGKISRNVIPWCNYSVVSSNNNYNVKQLEELGYIPTCSFLFPRKCLDDMPVIDKKAFHGDGYLKLALTIQGYAHYIPETTCVYRFGVQNSSTTRWKNDAKVFSSYANKYALMYRELNRVTNYEYNDLFEDRAVSWEVENILKAKNYKKMKEKQYKKYFKIRGKKALLRYYLICYFSPIYNLLKFLKGK